MKPKLLIAAIFITLVTMGFDCVNDPIEVALNLAPFNGCFNVNSGTNHNFGGSTTIDSRTLYDQSYELTGVGMYDITVQTVGTNLGTVSNGQVFVSIPGSPNTLLATYSGSWSDFLTPKSIINSPTLVQPNQAGIALLVSAVQNGQVVTVSASGTVQNTPPTSTESSVCFNAYVQARGHL